MISDGHIIIIYFFLDLFLLSDNFEQSMKKKNLKNQYKLLKENEEKIWITVLAKSLNIDLWSQNWNKNLEPVVNQVESILILTLIDSKFPFELIQRLGVNVRHCRSERKWISFFILTSYLPNFSSLAIFSKLSLVFFS